MEKRKKQILEKFKENKECEVKEIFLEKNEIELICLTCGKTFQKTPMALEIVLTTKGNYKLYNSKGTMLKFLDKKYHTLSEIIFWIKRI